MKIAVFYIGEATASTVYDHLASFGLYGQYTYQYIDVLKDTITFKDIDFYDVIIIHYTVFMFDDARCPSWLRILLRNTKAKKIVFIQDEYRLINHIIENLNFIKADVLYTCVPESEIEKVYSKEKLPYLIKINTLTGFVAENLLSIYRPTYQERSMDVVYRARKLSAWYGRLGQEKWKIADKFRQDATTYDLATDISYLEKDRIYGNEWIEFLKNSKATIGCESGASVFDFTGDIQKQVERYEKQHPDAPFEEIEENFLKRTDGRIRLNQISPRCFESAALGTLMILYEGDYSNILKPWRHYVPLKKDHSNMDEIVKVLKSPDHWGRITQCAFEEIALNNIYHYKGFVKTIEKDLNDLFKIDSSHEQSVPFISNAPLNFSSKKNFSRNYVIEFLKNKLRTILGRKITRKLVFLKYRMVLSLQTFKIIYADYGYPPRWCLHSLKKDFCEEYQFLKSMQKYISCTEEKCGYVPIHIKNSYDGKKTIINLSMTKKYQTEFVFSFSNAKHNTCLAIVEDSWGIPQNIRGKNILLKYFKICDSSGAF